jgi:hypothetical protein
MQTSLETNKNVGITKPNIFATLLTTIVLFICPSDVGQNELCHTSQFIFNFQDETITASQQATHPGCGLGFILGKRQIFNQATIASLPSHGKLVPLAPFEFAYYPADDYYGTDSYAIRICGVVFATKDKPGHTGCSTLIYNANVQ